MELFVLRHGIAVEMAEWKGRDETRPLTDKGEQQVARVVAALRLRGELEAELILTSPFVRARQTAESAGLELHAPVEELAALASGASAMDILDALHCRKLPERLMLVGHNPDLPMLIGALSGSSSRQASLDRCGLARLEGELAPGRMQLVWIKSPNEV